MYLAPLKPLGVRSLVLPPRCANSPLQCGESLCALVSLTDHRADFPREIQVDLRVSDRYRVAVAVDHPGGVDADHTHTHTPV